MDAEKSSNSSFEDLSNLNEPSSEEGNTATMDIKQNLANKPTPNETDYTRLTSGEDNLNKTNDDESANESEMPTSSKNHNFNNEDSEKDDKRVMDILGNGQLVKTLISRPNDSDLAPMRGNKVTISLVGKLKDGTVVEGPQTLDIHVGDYEVVQGVDMALPLMVKGEIAKIECNPRFAYGSLGLTNESDPARNIPPDATIIYEVNLIDFKDEDYADLKSFEIRRSYGNRKKERANFWYNRSEYNMAIQLYRRALDYLDDRDGDPDAAFNDEDIKLTNAQLQILLEDRLIVYNNMAMAQIKIQAFDAALKAVDTVLRCQPNNSKALYRKGRILEGKGDVKGAISLLQKAATIEPDNRQIQQDLARFLIKARREENNEKALYQKMLGHAKRLEQKSGQPEKRGLDQQNSRIKWLRYLMGSILVGVAGVAIYRYKY